MSPREYRMGKRQAAVDETRARILTAARDVLTSSGRYAEFSIPGVARAADVARVTVYNQFGSKTGLLEALSDELASRGGLHRVATIVTEGDPAAAIGRFVAVFTGFWQSDRLVIRRLRALAALDPELEKAIAGRDERRRNGARRLVQRLPAHGQGGGLDTDTAVDVLAELTSFETYDALADADRTPDEATAVITDLAHRALGVANPQGRGELSTAWSQSPASAS